MCDLLVVAELSQDLMFIFYFVWYWWSFVNFFYSFFSSGGANTAKLKFTKVPSLSSFFFQIVTNTI